MSIKYNIQFSLNLGKVFSEVGALTESVNTHLAAMGCDEKLTLRGQPFKMTLTVERELTEVEIEKMKDIIMGQLCESFVGSNPMCELFRRQSGNVPQSAS